MLEELLPRVQRIQTVGPVIWRDNPTVYGPEHLCLQTGPVMTAPFVNRDTGDAHRTLCACEMCCNGGHG